MINQTKVQRYDNRRDEIEDDCINRNVFSWRLKTGSDVASVTSVGSKFQVRAAERQVANGWPARGIGHSKTIAADRDTTAGLLGRCRSAGTKLGAAPCEQRWTRAWPAWTRSAVEPAASTVPSRGLCNGRTYCWPGSRGERPRWCRTGAGVTDTDARHQPVRQYHSLDELVLEQRPVFLTLRQAANGAH